MKNLRDLEFLADKARELLDRQISSFRATHAKAGSIIALSTIFVPIYIFVIEKAAGIIQILSIIPILLLGYSLILMIQILKTKRLDQGFNEDQFDKLINKKYEKILLYEIGAKKASIKDNQLITAGQNKKFNKGLNFTIAAVLFSFLLLFTNVFINPPNRLKMSEKEKKEKTDPKKEPSQDQQTKSRTIPSVPKEERIQLNEGKDNDSVNKSNK